MDDIRIELLSKKDIEKYRTDLINIMYFILADNITQKYPESLAEQYVMKMAKYIDDGSAIITGAICNDKLIGLLWAYELNIFGEKRLHIDMIGVEKCYRRQHIAKRMMDEQINQARKRNIKVMEALVTKKNDNSCKWFRSIGFIDERIKMKWSMNDENRKDSK